MMTPAERVEDARKLAAEFRQAGIPWKREYQLVCHILERAIKSLCAEVAAPSTERRCKMPEDNLKPWCRWHIVGIDNGGIGCDNDSETKLLCTSHLGESLCFPCRQTEAECKRRLESSDPVSKCDYEPVKPRALTPKAVRDALKKLDATEKRADAEHKCIHESIDEQRDKLQEDCPHENTKKRILKFRRHLVRITCEDCGADLETADEEIDRG